MVGFVPVASEPVYHPLILESCHVLVRREERFAKTAVGWILRDLSKLDAETVKGFIEQELGYFSVEALKNALKYSGKSEHARYTQLLRASQSRPPS